MGEVSTIGLDIAKSIFQIHGVDADAGKSTTADAPDVQGAFMYGALDFDVKTVFSMETDNEKVQSWDCLGSSVVGCDAVLASMVARKHCGALA